MCVKQRPPRERACSALCVPEDSQLEGRPLWISYLPEVDTVLKSALSDQEWQRLLAEGPDC
jgi:hypothetical protein